MRSTTLILPLLGLMNIILVAQGPPAEILRRTPPPGPTDGVSRQDAGSVTLSDGTRLVPARDPLANQGTNAKRGQPNQIPPIRGRGQQFDVGQGSFGPQQDPFIVTREQSERTQPQASPEQDAAPLLAQQQEIADQLRVLRSELKSTQVQGQRNDGLDVDPEGALIMAQIDPKTGKPRRRASQIAREAGLVMIPAGTMLTIRNVTRVQTQLGGTCVVVVEYDVLDAQMGSIGLPRGTRGLCAIQSVSGEAQNRAAIILRQLVDPNGDQVQIMVPESATNSIGMAGIGPSDGAIVNRHLGQKFGYALAWGLLGGVTGQNSTGPLNPQTAFSDTLRSNVASSFGQVGQSYLSQALAIKTDIEIPENTSMRVILGNPIYIKPWKRLRPF